MNAFFFAPESPRPAALMRILVGAVFLCAAAVRWPYVVELYSAGGVPMPLFPQTGYHPLEPSAALAVILYAVMLFALAAATVGWQTRVSLWVALVLSAWFGLLDSPGTFKKYSVVGLHLMLLLSLSGCGHAWSVDRLVARDRGRLVRLSPAWPRRLMQVLVASIYLGAAITKLRLPGFATGEMLTFSLLDDQWGGGRVGQWLVTRPDLLTLASVATIVFEFAFPMLVWVRRMRRPMLLLAAAFHVVLWSLMQLSIFSPVMLVALLAFMDESDFGLIGRLVRRVREGVGLTDFNFARVGRWSAGSVSSGKFEICKPDPGLPDIPESRLIDRRAAAVLLYPLAAAVAGVLGYIHQSANDRYGVFGEPRQITRPFLESKIVEDMLAEAKPPLEEYFYRFEIGSEMANLRVSGERERFRRGMIVYAVARIARPHPPLRLELLLVAPNDPAPVARRSFPPDSSYSHVWAGFLLTPDSPAGRYLVVIQADGVEVARRSFDVL